MRVLALVFVLVFAGIAGADEKTENSNNSGSGVNLSATVGLGGLSLAGLSLWLNHRSRTSQLRQKLYEEQLKVYPEVLSVLEDAQISALVYDSIRADRLEPHLTGEAKEEREEDRFWDAADAYKKGRETLLKVLPIVPANVYLAIDDCLTSIMYIVYPVTIEDDMEKVGKHVLSLRTMSLRKKSCESSSGNRSSRQD